MTEGLSRLEYLRLLVEGYRAIEVAVPVELRREHDELATAEAERLAKIAAKAREEWKKIEAEWAKQARQEREKRESPEAALEEHWSNQRQYGKERAARIWAEKFGQELPLILEVAETEEEMLEAIRKLRNVAQAKKGPMKGTRPGGAEKNSGRLPKSYRNGKPVF